MNKDKFLELEVQLFADQADNDVEDIDVDIDTIDDTDPDIADGDVSFEPIDKTKAFSDRLKQKTKEIETELTNKFEQEKAKVAKLKGFNNWDEFEKAIQNDSLIEMGVEDVDKFQTFLKQSIDTNPDIIKARQILEQQERQSQEQLLNEQVNMIMEIDSTIKSLDDILTLENYDQIFNKVQTGYSLYDAYVLSSLGRINVDNITSAKKNAIKDLTSKSHLKRASGTAGTEVVVPTDVFQTYKRNLPGWSDEQIKKDYAKRTKGSE